MEREDTENSAHLRLTKIHRRLEGTDRDALEGPVISRYHSTELYTTTVSITERSIGKATIMYSSTYAFDLGFSHVVYDERLTIGSVMSGQDKLKLLY